MQFRGFEVGWIESLGIHHRARHVFENQKLLRRQPQVVAVGRTSETQHRMLVLIRIEMTNQAILKRLQHAGGSLFRDPAVVFKHQKPRRSSVT